MMRFDIVWKSLSVLLIAYALYMGLTTPVGPGIAGISPERAEITDSVLSISLEGYNTHFEKDYPVKVWLKKDSFYICGHAEIKGENELALQFPFPDLSLPKTAQNEAFTVVLEDEKHGLFLSPGILTLSAPGQSDSLISCDAPSGFKKAAYFSFPYRGVLFETIRNLNFHVPMWFAMIALLFASFIYSILYLNKLNPMYDVRANALAYTGVLFGLLGISTGAFWARFTWGVFWSPDPKLNGAAIGVLIYLAYQILRKTIKDQNKIGRLAAVYNILAFPIFIVLIIILPKVADFSLHPGSGDSVGFNNYDLDNNLRIVFYPAVTGFILFGFWLAQLHTRISSLEIKKQNE